MVSNRISMLWSFIKFLEDNGVFKFDIDDIDSRLLLQKYVFLARFYGLDMGYDFNLYIHGPFSTELGRDMFMLKKYKSRLKKRSPKPLPEKFRIKDFLQDVMNKDKEWLWMMTTMLSIKEYNKDIGKERLIDTLIFAKITWEINPSFMTMKTLAKMTDEINIPLLRKQLEQIIEVNEK